METMLDLPTITGLPTDPVSIAIMTPAKPTAPTATLKETALASFVPIEAHMRTLAARYKDVAYDVTTGKGMADAKAARLVLRDEGRYAVQRLVKRVKDEANDLKRVIDTRGDEVIAITKGIEDSIDGQITAEEERRAAAKAEAERIERDRIGALEVRLAGLSVWIDRCKVPGITSERIRNGIALLEQAPIDDTWADFKDRAIARRAEILGVMQGLYQQHLIAEVEAQRLEEQRAEQVRVDALLAARKAELDAREAEIKRQADELAAARAEQERRRQEDIDAAKAMAAALKSQEYTEGQDSQQVLKAEPATADATDRENPADASPVGGPMGAGQPAAAGPVGEPDYDALEADLGDPPHYDGEPRDQTEAEIEAANGPEVDLPPGEGDEDEGGIDVLLRDCLGLIEVLSEAYAGRFPSHPKQSPEWWADVRLRIENLGPRLLIAAAMKKAGL